jgi:hypothetical protein
MPQGKLHQHAGYFEYSKEFAGIPLSYTVIYPGSAFIYTQNMIPEASHLVPLILFSYEFTSIDLVSYLDSPYCSFLKLFLDPERQVLFSTRFLFICLVVLHLGRAVWVLIRWSLAEGVFKNLARDRESVTRQSLMEIEQAIKEVVRAFQLLEIFRDNLRYQEELREQNRREREMRREISSGEEELARLLGRGVRRSGISRRGFTPSGVVQQAQKGVGDHDIYVQQR